MVLQARNTHDRVAGHFLLGAQSKMTSRSIRRAAERKALKLARKAEKTFAPPLAAPQPETETEASATYTVSPAQLVANRENAQLSTGPTSLNGKATSCLNAVKTGLTGRTVLLHTDDAADYQRHIADYQKEFSPIGPRECDLVQSIADTVWRLRRIPGLELAIYAQGRVQFADACKDHDEALRPAMIELQTFLTYEKQLRNLQLQESRLSRRREKEIAELRELQQARKEKETEAVAENGFEFSTPGIQPETVEIDRGLPSQIAPKLNCERLKTNTQAA
jgi:hypothetical protein